MPLTVERGKDSRLTLRIYRRWLWSKGVHVKSSWRESKRNSGTISVSSLQGKKTFSEVLSPDFVYSGVHVHPVRGREI